MNIKTNIHGLSLRFHVLQDMIHNIYKPSILYITCFCTPFQLCYILDSCHPVTTFATSTRFGSQHAEGHIGIFVLCYMSTGTEILKKYIKWNRNRAQQARVYIYERIRKQARTSDTNWLKPHIDQHRVTIIKIPYGKYILSIFITR